MHLTEKHYDAIQAYFERRKSVIQIAEEFNVTRQAVYRWIRCKEGQAFIDKLRNNITREAVSKAVIASDNVVETLVSIVEGDFDPKKVFAKIQAGTVLLNIAGLNNKTVILDNRTDDNDSARQKAMEFLKLNKEKGPADNNAKSDG